MTIKIQLEYLYDEAYRRFNADFYYTRKDLTIFKPYLKIIQEGKDQRSEIRGQCEKQAEAF